MKFFSVHQAPFIVFLNHKGCIVKIKFYLLFLLLLIFGCANVESYRKPGIDPCKYKRIAVVKFANPSHPTIGQQVADRIAFEFTKKGYTVLERSQLEAIIDEKKINQYGLTDSDRATVKLSGIDAMVVGSVSRYTCFPQEPPPPFYRLSFGYDLERNNCWVSLSFKMLDLQTNEIVLTLAGHWSITDIDMTQDKVLQELLKKISNAIPSIKGACNN